MFPRFRLPAALVVLLSIWLAAVAASSTPPRPLKRVAHPSTLALEILPRRPSSLNTRSSHAPVSTVLLHSDTFRLTLAAFDDIFHLHLRPNDHLVHPAARINYYRNGDDGSAVLHRTEPLLRESVRAYWGEVVRASDSPRRMREDAAGVVPRPVQFERGWARIMVHNHGDSQTGTAPIFEGAFSVDGVVHHVSTRENYLRNKHALDPQIVMDMANPDSHLVIYRDSDVMSTPEEEAVTGRPLDSVNPLAQPKKAKSCSHDTLGFNTNPQQNPVLRKPVQTSWYDPLRMFEHSDPWDNITFLGKRDDVAGGGASSSNFAGSIGLSAGCAQSQKVVYMGVAADCQYTSIYGSTQAASSQILNNWNSASSLYKTTFNVSLGILHIDMHDATCPNPPDTTRPWNTGCANVTLNDRLSLFSQWRGTLGDDSTGLWHLMSGCPTGTEVGVAWLGTLCQQSASGDAPSVVSGTAVSTQGRTEWSVVAHEIGHNFGAIHDCQDGCTFNQTTPCCPMTTNSCDANDAFIMSPVTSSSQSQFSQCTVGNICSLMLSTTQNHVNASCLQDPNPAQQTISLQMCGNGIVESGEECDPGPGVNSTCCDSTTCKFTTGSVCDPSSSACCTTACSFAPSTQVCRASKDAQCDTPEMCTGNSSSCPTDVVSPNGKSCGAGGLTCASGQCTSESLQCQNVGASMNLTTACSRPADQTCQVSCQDPTNANQCVQLQTQLIDGSPCGLGGTCGGGTCHPGSVLDTVKAWYVQNLQIAIPITVVAGIVFLIILWLLFLWIRRCSRGRTSKAIEPQMISRKDKGERLVSWQPTPGNASPEPLLIAPQRVAIPPALRAGSNASYQNAPSIAHSRNHSLAARNLYGSHINGFPSRAAPRNSSWDGQYGAARDRVTPPQPLRPPLPRAPSRGPGAQEHWVDAVAWNGNGASRR